MIEILLSDEFPKQEGMMWLTNFLGWVTSKIVFDSTMHDVELDNFIFLTDAPNMTLLLFVRNPSQQRLMEMLQNIPLCYRGKLTITEGPTPQRFKSPLISLEKDDVFDYYLSE